MLIMMSVIEWKALKQAVKGLPMGKQRWQTKLVTGFIGHYAALYDWKEMKSPSCLLCSAEVKETSSHILLCTNKRAIQFYDHRIQEDLQINMETTNTHHGLIKLFKEILLAWRRGLIDSIDTQIYPPNIQEAFREQTCTGWTNFVVGRWSKKWQVIQRDYYTMVKSRRSAKRWATALI